jgi:DNA-binding beta-propeller fold protein YncE
MGDAQVWGGLGSAVGEFAHPADLVAAPDGSAVYIVDEDNARVEVLFGGRMSGERGAANPGPTGLADPVAVAVAPDGSIAVLDAGRRRIVRFQGARTSGFSLVRMPLDQLGAGWSAK